MKTQINILEKNLDTYELVCTFDDKLAALDYANKYGYYVTINGVFIN